MSLDLRPLLPRVQQLGHTIAAEENLISEELPALAAALDLAAKLPHDGIMTHIDEVGERWTGAIPSREPVNLIRPEPEQPDDVVVVAADGSQIYPDRHGLAEYALVNIGSICIEQDTNKPPSIKQDASIWFELPDRSELEFAYDDVTLINIQRDVAELGALAEWASIQTGSETLLMLDNSLLLWLSLRIDAKVSKSIDALLQEYMGHLDRIKQSGAALAGVIDRPRSANVTTLLSSLPNVGKQRDEVHRIEDRRLYANVLPPGYRTAVFRHPSPLNRDFRTAGHEIHFFYLHTNEKDQVLRVEVPIWVSESPQLLDLVHGGILHQCTATEGYPYALIRAHELAVVTQDDRKVFNEIILNELQKHGIDRRISAKSQSKTWTSSSRRHRL